jgi:hypothetical protein
MPDPSTGLLKTEIAGSPGLFSKSGEIFIPDYLHEPKIFGSRIKSGAA